MKIFIIMLLLFITPALADSNVVFNTFGPNNAGPAPASLSIAMHPDENHNMLMMSLASDMAGIKSVTIIGNGKVLVTCQKPICTYVWGRIAMRSGENTVVLQSINSNGITNVAKGYITKPPAL